MEAQTNRSEINPFLRNIKHIIVNLTSFSLLMYYMLPGTTWRKWSPLDYSPVFEIGCNYVTNICGLTLACGLLLWSYYKCAGNIGSKLICIAISLYAALMVVTMIGWRQDFIATSHCFLILSALSVGLLAARILNDSRLACQLLCSLAALQGCYLVYYQFLHHNVLVSGDVLRAGGTFNHPDIAYTIMMICLPLAMSSAIKTEGNFSKIFWMTCTSVIFASLMVTWDRGGMIAAAIGLAWLAFKTVGSTRSFTFILIGLIALSGFVWLHRIQGETNQASSNRSIAGRYHLWGRGARIFTDHWVTGVGIGSLEIPIRIQRPGNHDLEVSIEPKNLLLLWLDEMGIAGGMLFGLFVFSLFRALTNHHNLTAYGLGAAWLTLLLAGVFDTPIGTAERYCSNAVLGALLGATILLKDSAREKNMATAATDADKELEVVR